MKFVRWLIALAIMILIVVLALSNRQGVVVSFDPFSSDATDPLVALPSMPLFVVMFALFILGLLVGFAAQWIAHGKWRRTARIAKAEVKTLSRDLEKAKEQPAQASDGKSGQVPQVPAKIDAA